MVGVVRAGKNPGRDRDENHADTVAALAHPSVRQRYDAIGVPVITSTPAELAALLASEIQKWGPIIKAAGMQSGVRKLRRPYLEGSR